MKILIADDDPPSCSLLEMHLKNFHYEAVVAQDGTEAWDVIQRPDAPLIALLDWNMPGMTGIQVCKALRAQKAALPVYAIIVTSHTERGYALRRQSRVQFLIDRFAQRFALALPTRL